MTEDIQVYEVPQEGWSEAEAASDEQDERLRMLRNRRVGGPRLARHQLVGSQTCVKSTPVDPYPAHIALGGKRGGVRYSRLVGVNRKSQQRDLRSSGLAVELGDGGAIACYEPESKSGSSGLSDARAWGLYGSEGRDLPSGEPARAALSDHSFVRPSAGCCSRRSAN